MTTFPSKRREEIFHAYDVVVKIKRLTNQVGSDILE